jgi:hypothetical protein
MKHIVQYIYLDTTQGPGKGIGEFLAPGGGGAHGGNGGNGTNAGLKHTIL